METHFGVFKATEQYFLYLYADAFSNLVLEIWKHKTKSGWEQFALASPLKILRDLSPHPKWSTTVGQAAHHTTL